MPVVTPIWIVSFSPESEEVCVGGFDWFWKQSDAEAQYEQVLRDDPNAYRVRMLCCALPESLYGDDPAEQRERITEYLDKNLDGVEVKWPAVRDHLPASLEAQA